MSMIVNLQSIMDANFLIGYNFLDWLKNLIIVLIRERFSYVLIESLPQSPTVDASKSVQRAYRKCLVDSARTGLIILTSMSPKF